ncbi:thioesterase family protein [Mameliella alba]|nr:thioesterase family protein [Antarctobacter heliothermus]MBY6142492.1 thioesterase family protein [Mameliella alba]MCA0953783.1 thioesterase family protein [Mameliella alba]
MYPFLRLARNAFLARRAPRLGLLETHVSTHVCQPWDLDLWVELNNGRTLTIYDLGRIPLAYRTGLIDVLKREGWGLTVAGSVVRYRRRVRLFDKVEMHSRVLGWDKRFIYIDQSMWKSDGECSSHAVFRTALTDANGIVTTDRSIRALGGVDQTPVLPDWVQKWIEAEDARPWPPATENAPDVIASQNAA